MFGFLLLYIFIFNRDEIKSRDIDVGSREEPTEKHICKFLSLVFSLILYKDILFSEFYHSFSQTKPIKTKNSFHCSFSQATFQFLFMNVRSKEYFLLDFCNNINIKMTKRDSHNL